MGGKLSSDNHKIHIQRQYLLKSLSHHEHNEQKRRSCTLDIPEKESIHLSPTPPQNMSELCFNTKQKGEDDRMNSNQFALKALFNGNVLSTIKANVDFHSSDVMVLDVGCGSGSWLMDMATEFPSAQFIGIDQASLFPTDIRPPNVEFKKVNILNGLPYEDNTFDVVQMRLFLFAFNKYQWVQSMKEIYRVLKPGGFIQLLEVQMIDPGDEIVQSFGNKVKEIMESNDCDPEICSKLPSLIESSGFVPMEDVRESVNLATNDSLANEFMYIIDISVNSSRSLIMAIYNLQSEEEYQNLKAIYLESRRTTSESTWYCAVGQKPHPHS